MPVTSAISPLTTIRSSRSAVACQACRQRKVRCSLAVTGKPCIGCTQDRAECIVVPRQRRKPQRSRPQVNRYREGSVPSPGSLSTGDTSTHPPFDHESNSPTDRPGLQDGQDEADTNPREPYSVRESGPGDGGVRDRVEVAAPSLGQSQDVGDTTVQNGNRGNVEDEERNGIEIAEAVLGQSQRVGQVPFYTGAETGPTSVLDICSPEKSLPTHFLIPSHTRPPFPDADRNYLRTKGVLTLPRKESCEALLRAYLHHVHPLMPVIEVDHVLDYQYTGRLHEYNILLLWSIFSTAANFVSPNIYEQEGYKSRKEMKAVMYSRAKTMYTLSEGMDKIVLLQSSLLMGFWHSALDGHMQPWYWTGTAVNLCQMLGLHRNPDSPRVNDAITDRQRCLWRRLWWSSFYRDRWLGLNLGRPLRISLSDCDTPMPLVTDLLNDVAGIPECQSAGFLPSDLSRLASCWVALIELSKHLGNVITMNYQILKIRPSLQQFESLEAEILQCKLPDQYVSGLTSLARFHSFHVHLHYQALLITFYRPYGSQTPTGLDPTNQGDWQHRMRLKADAAASMTNVILDSLAQDNLLEYAGPMTPPLLVPAMHMHLLLYKTAGSLPKRLRLHKLEMCMLIMEELQKNYTVASIYRGIFLKAMQQICPPYQTGAALSSQMINSTPASDPGARVNEAVTDRFAPEPLDNNALLFNSNGQEAEIAVDFVDSFMDEATLFNFWQTWNGM